MTETYSYDDADKLQSIKIGGVTQKSYGYDTAGRTTSLVTGAGTTTLAYDYEGRITTITYPSTATNTFTYSGLDARVSKVDSLGTSTYKRDGAGITSPVLSDGFAVYTPGLSERRGSTTKHYGADRLGTNSLEIDGSQTVTAAKAYDAFGVPVSSSGSSASPFGFAGKHGYQEDLDSGLKLLGCRYYDSSVGRFLSRDPAKDGSNWYTYCENNPIACIDPDGQVVWFVAVLVVGFIWGSSLTNADAPMVGQPTPPPPSLGQRFTGGLFAGTFAVATASAVRVASGLISLGAAKALEKLKKAKRGPEIKPGESGGPGAGKDFSKGTKDAARGEGNGICPYCGMPIAGRGHVDHVIPKKQGGNNTIHNAHCTCAFCNLSKGIGKFPKNRPPGYNGPWPPKHWK